MGDCYTSTYTLSKTSGSNTAFGAAESDYVAMLLATRSTDAIQYDTSMTGRILTDLAGITTVNYEKFQFWIRVSTSDGRSHEKHVMVTNMQCTSLGSTITVLSAATPTYTTNTGTVTMYTASQVHGLFPNLGDCYVINMFLSKTTGSNTAFTSGEREYIAILLATRSTDAIQYDTSMVGRPQ